MEKLLPPALAPYGPLIVGLAQAALIFVIGWIVAKWVASLSLRAFRRFKIDEAIARFLSSLVQYAVLAAAVVAALGSVGVQTTSLVAILGSAALAIGLALQGSLSNFASGVMILLFRPFTIGDTITIAGNTGTVDEIGLFATTLHNPDNHKIIIPNAQATGGSIVNLTVLGTRRANIPVGVAYGSDVATVIEVLTKAASAVEGALEDPAPAAVLVDFGASSINFNVTVWAKSADYFGVMCKAKVAVYEALETAGIEIPFDQVVMHNAAQ